MESTLAEIWTVSHMYVCAAGDGQEKNMSHEVVEAFVFLLITN